MTLEMRLEQQIARNAELLGEQPAPHYTVISSDAEAAAWLGMTEDEYETLLANAGSLDWDGCEIEGD